MLLAPAAPLTPSIARVTCSTRALACSLPEYSDAFRAVMKKAGLRWDSSRRAYTRSLEPETSGRPADRAAEIAGRLLAAGFSVDVEEEIARKIQAADWEPEHQRWVLSIDGKFTLRWRSRDENLYWRAKTLPGAVYDSGGIAVPALYFEEVAGFAAEHDFRFTSQAAALLDQARRDYTRLVLPEIRLPAKPEPQKLTIRRACDPRRFADLPARSFQTSTSLYDYQAAAVKKLLPLKLGALFMDMGTGKTRCAIELIARRQARISRVVWFCPVSLKLTVAEELAKHAAGESVFIFDDQVTDAAIPPAFVYVVGIESMSSSDRVVLAANRLIDEDTFVIVDESGYIKGHASKRTMRITEISRRARYRLLLTGTPLTQGVEDLYAQFKFLSPDILGYGSFYSFARHHLEYSDRFPGMIVRAYGMESITEKIAPFVYQVTKEECLDLPGKLYDQWYCSLTREQDEAYQQAKAEILNGIEEELPDYLIFQLFTALQQIVSGFYHRKGELIEYPHFRLDTLRAVIDGIPEGEKVIIWCKYIYSLRQIAAMLPGAALYYGELNEQQRAAELSRFRDDARFLIATQATGGHGLTINEAHYHIFYENEFKYSHRIQAEDRSHRIGQTQPVTYIDIVSRSGIDRRIMAALAKKEDVLKSFKASVKSKKGALGDL